MESKNIILIPGCNVHFIGIGGSSMSGLAEIMLMKGYKISGSDEHESPGTNKLMNLGATIYIGHNEQQIPEECKLVVYTLAISDDNCELLKAQQMNITILERGKFLGFLTKEYPTSIAVSGTHGKTTTASMVACVLLECSLDPSVHLGGILPRIGGNVRASNSPYFVTEACEYHENFLNLSPFGSVILNIEEEHMDYFRDLQHIKDAFTKFIKLLPIDGFLVACADNENILDIIVQAECIAVTYAIENTNADFIAKDISYNDMGCGIFSVYKNGEFYAKVCLNVPGKHNILNALAAFAVGYMLNCENSDIVRGLESFTGAKRRFELKGRCNGAPVIDDYAHHPTEIEATLFGAKNSTKGKMFCIFQPHTYSRAKNFIKDFARSFNLAFQVIVTDIYASREINPGDINSQMLTDSFIKDGVNAIYMPDFDEVVSYIKAHITADDLVITLGAGDVNKIAVSLCD